MGRYFHGQIVLASMSNGTKIELHPALIIDGKDDYQITGELLVIITFRFISAMKLILRQNCTSLLGRNAIGGTGYLSDEL